MTKSGLIQAVAVKLKHASSRDVEIVVNTLFDALTDALRAGDRAEIRGFGSFTVRKRQERRGRNPKTGRAIAVPAKRVPFFTAGQQLRDRVMAGGPTRIPRILEASTDTRHQPFETEVLPVRRAAG